MVKSGLTQEALAEANPSGVPRVSQYRLAAHLGMAFAVYALTVRAAQGILQDWNMAKGLSVKGAASVGEAVKVLHSRSAGRMRMLAGGMTGLVFLTAISGESSFTCARKLCSETKQVPLLLDSMLDYYTIPFLIWATRLFHRHQSSMIHTTQDFRISQISYGETSLKTLQRLNSIIDC